MAKRDVVFINYEKIVFLIKKIYRNNTIFCEELNKKMGTTRTTKWVSEWKRNSNLPSPKEAAVICILLKTTPDEILLREGETPEETAKCLEDIETVRKLVEAEGIKEAPATEGEGEKDALIKAVREITDKDTALAVFDELSKKMRELM
nr:MAG TPA: DNA binding protein [Caudoviricetes sp.]DAW85053.1 MAG TPA: DNA binding protein [Bacteriophage sp.]